MALHRKAVGQLFTVPHYLFGDWGGEARARWGQRAFLLALMLLFNQIKDFLVSFHSM